MSQFEYYMKEDACRNSHTTRHPQHQVCGKETTLAIERPIHKESRITTKFYSKFDEFLMENGTSTEPSTNGKLQRTDVIPLKLPQAEVIAKLEAHCLSKKKKYDNWSNTCSVTYSVPSTFEVSVRDVQDSNFVQRVNPTMSMIDGKLYDRDFIYEKNPWGGDWRCICPVKFSQPLLKNAQNTVDRRITPLPISSLSSPSANNYTFCRNYWYEHPRESAKPHHGILQHDTPWSYENSRAVFNDLFVDLGTPQHISHIGTVGSFIPTAVHPFPTGSERRAKTNPNAHKYNRSIIVKEDPYQQQCWPVSYRLFYKNTASEDYHYWGTYTANTNSYELVVNDVREEMPGLGAVRYLMLKVVSSHPSYYRKSYSHFVHMSIAVYGRETPSPKPRVVGGSDAVTAAPAIIKYTLSVPPAGKALVEVKQHRHNHYTSTAVGGGGGGGASKHGGKKGLRQSVVEEVEDYRRSPLLGEEHEDHCYTSEEEQEEQGDEGLFEPLPEALDSFWDPVIPYSEEQLQLQCQWGVDMRVSEDQALWPALPCSASKVTAVVVAVEGGGGVSSSASTDSEHSSPYSEVRDTDSEKSSDDSDWMFI